MKTIQWILKSYTQTYITRDRKDTVTKHPAQNTRVDRLESQKSDSQIIQFTRTMKLGPPLTNNSVTTDLNSL